MTSVSLFGLSLLSFVFSKSYHDNYMDIQTLDGITLPIHTCGGIGGIFEHKLYIHSGFNCTQNNCFPTTISTLFLLDLDQTSLTSTSLLYNNKNTNWTQIDYDYFDSLDSSIYFGISTSSSSTQFGHYSYAMHPGSTSYSTNIMLKYDLYQHQYIDPSNYNSLIPSNKLIDTCNINDGNRYLYSIGGRDYDQQSDYQQVYRYDTLNDIWDTLKPLNVARFAASCVMDNTNNIYVLGGNNGDTKKKECLSSIEKYDTQTDIWTLLSTNLIQERYQHVSVLHPNDWIISIGGIDGFDKPVPIEIFDPRNQYTATTNMMYDRTQFYYGMYIYPTANVLFLYGGINDDGYYDDIQYIVLSPSDHLFPTIPPTLLPSVSPTFSPTLNPTPIPSTYAPSIRPSTSPTVLPTLSPTILPTLFPSNAAHATPITLNPSSNAAHTTLSPTVSPTVTPSQYTTIYSITSENDRHELTSSISYTKSIWTLITAPGNITWTIIAGLILLISCCACCLCYYICRAHKYHGEAKALKLDKSRQIQFPQTVPSKSMDASTYTSKSGFYDIDAYLNGDLASSPSSYLSSSHNRSYNSNAMTRPSPPANRRSPISRNRQYGYRLNVQHISIPIGIDNLTDDDGEDSTKDPMPIMKPSLQNSLSDNRNDHIQSGRQRPWTEWKQKQQQMMSYRNQMQWQLQRPRALSYQQYQYQPYFGNTYQYGYYGQRNQPPVPPIQLQQEDIAKDVNNNASPNKLLNVPPPPPPIGSDFSDITHITASSMSYDKCAKDDPDEGDSVTSVTSEASSSAHSHTYKEQDEEEDDEDILSEISPINVGNSNNSLMEEKAQELDSSQVTIQINSRNMEQSGNKGMKRRKRQMKVFQPSQYSPELKEIMSLNDKQMDDNYRFEPGASIESLSKLKSQMSLESIIESEVSTSAISRFNAKSLSL